MLPHDSDLLITSTKFSIEDLEPSDAWSILEKYALNHQHQSSRQVVLANEEDIHPEFQNTSSPRGSQLSVPTTGKGEQEKNDSTMHEFIEVCDSEHVRTPKIAIEEPCADEPSLICDKPEKTCLGTIGCLCAECRGRLMRYLAYKELTTLYY
ncbi:uncharacterized protein G2W53_041245 [Senna tora]|uniref:Uncharacterized protein n=1 Tax=Senna tora TaxID=362788 RepID=A0A834SEW1_9FABA|nr:uncharacterized protein G2W53_041245 [Senna tora]